MLIAETLYLKILSGAPKKLPDKVSVSSKYLFQGLSRIVKTILNAMVASGKTFVVFFQFK